MSWRLYEKINQTTQKMAILYPSLEVIKRLKVKPTEGEWTLLKYLLNNLDNTYDIFFQPYLNGDNPDMIIMRKGSGVLIIEVKDWNLDYYTFENERRWKLKSDESIIKSPFSQVENYKKNLFDLHLQDLYYKKSNDKRYWATVNCVVYFHKASERQISEFISLDSSVQNYTGLLGYDSLNAYKINQLFSKFWLNKKSYFFDEPLYHIFFRYFKPPIHQIEEGKHINYTKEQRVLIKSEISSRRKIKGVAGAGKTLVLAKRAVNAHIRTGGRVLILTYNLSLKNYIHDRISDVREEFNWNAFLITNYHQFFKTQANNYNLEINSYDNWGDTQFFEQVKDFILRFDVILIDEIQDYKQEWIDIITKYFMHSDSEFVVFGDEKQNIYSRELDDNNEPIVRTIPGRWNKSLNTSHRFSSNIGNIAIKFQKSFFDQKYYPDEVNFISQIDFVQRIIEYHHFKTFSSKKLLEEVYKVLERNCIHSSDAGILCSKRESIRILKIC